MSIRSCLPVAACLAATALPALPAIGNDAPEPVQRYVSAINRADMGAALALFTDDARLVAGPECTEAAPCVGKAEIRSKFLEPMFANGLRLVPTRVAASGPDSMRIDLALEHDDFRDLGFGALRGVDEWRLRDGRIASVLFRFDPAHPPTKQFLQRMSEIAAEQRAAANAAPAAR